MHKNITLKHTEDKTMSNKQEYNNLNYGGGFTEEDIKRNSIKKQETLEEAAERMWNDPNEELTSKSSFIKGAKWQAEKMYSEEETLNLWNWLNDGFIIRKSLPTKEELFGWFKQF
jgi:hypothetical protein